MKKKQTKKARWSVYTSSTEANKPGPTLYFKADTSEPKTKKFKSISAMVPDVEYITAFGVRLEKTVVNNKTFLTTWTEAPQDPTQPNLRTFLHGQYLI